MSQDFCSGIAKGLSGSPLRRRRTGAGSCGHFRLHHPLLQPAAVAVPAAHAGGARRGGPVRAAVRQLDLQREGVAGSGAEHFHLSLTIGS